jgi:ABC-type bacteriocin/lantibiotic exporter with double-glycine peptidase domain
MKHKYPFHFQSAVHDCVPTCVLSLAEYYHVPVNLRELRQVLVTDPASGTPLKNLMNLQGLFQVQIGKIVELEEIPNYFPFIAYLNRGHAVVVWSYTKDAESFVVGDPETGIVEIVREDFLQQWEGLAVVLRPLQQQGAAVRTFMRTKGWIAESIGHVKYLKINWMPMLWISFVIMLLGALNSIYSLYYARFLTDLWPFVIFMLSCTILSGLLNWTGNLISAKLELKYCRLLGWKIRDALPEMDQRFYTMGDVSTRYSDVVTIVDSVMGMFRDIPYALVIFGASLFFLGRISILLAIFVVAFLVLIICLLSPFVRKVQNYEYTVRIKEAGMMNKLQQFMAMGKQEEVTSAWEEANLTRYRQSLWGIPISSLVGNSGVFPVLFVVLFLHWKTGGVSNYEDILSAIMIMSFAVDAGHTLYGRLVAWQTAQPSFHRLRDFLEQDRKEPHEELNVS